VQAFRHLIDPHRGGWLCFCLVVLALRLLVPAGYMPAIDAGGIAIVACPDGAAAAPPVMAGPADRHADRHADHHRSRHHDDDRGDHHGAGQICAFAGLSAPLLGGADSVLLAAALAWVAAAALALPRRHPARAAPYLRPPSHAPPALPRR
jgi:hypothetical protein